MARSPKVRATISGVKAIAQAQQRVVEHGHLDHHAADARRRMDRGLEGGVGPQGGPAETASSTSRWSSSAIICCPKKGIE
jgi:hypothetical protein